MFPDSPFSVPRGSFERPVPLVLVDPCDEPSITVKISRAWIPYVLGALQQLVLQSTWDTHDPDALWLVQQRAMSLLSCVVQAYDNPECEPGCASYPLDAPILTWAPTDPFIDPNYVPSGYRFPSWFIAGDVIGLPGVQKGDLVTDILHGPIVEPISSGFPRFRITCSGKGTINVEFVRFPTAGVVLITIDSDVGSAKFVDLDITLAAAVGTAESQMIIPIEITKDGDHVVDLTMLFSITEDPPFVHFGGGIRKIELCGFGVSPDPFPKTYLIDELEYQMTICEQLRWNDGVLEGLCCGDWTPIPGASGGLVPGGTTQPTSKPRPAPGQSECFNVLLNANNTWQLPVNIQDGDIITISEIQGAWTDGSGPWYCPDGNAYILNHCIPSARGHDGGDPDSTDYHMQLIAKVGSTFFSGTDGAFTIPSGTGIKTLVLQANDGTLGDNGGSISFKICIENGGTPPPAAWCYLFDFTASAYAWVEDTRDGYHATWTLGQGWSCTEFPSGDVVDIKLTLGSAITVTEATIYGVAPSPVGGGSGVGLYMPVPSHVFQINPIPNAGAFEASGTTPLTSSVIQIAMGESPSGAGLRCTGLLLRGTGVNPFGADNC